MRTPAGAQGNSRRDERLNLGPYNEIRDGDGGDESRLRRGSLGAAQVGDNAFEGAPAPLAHGWAAVYVVPDRA